MTSDKKIHQLGVDKVTNVIAALSDIMFIIDRNGVFLDYYSSDPSRFLINEDRIIGSSIYDIFPEKEAEKHIRIFRDSISSGHINNFDYTIHVDGVDRYFEARISKLNDSSVLSIVRDITERKNAQKALAESEKKFRQIAEFLPEAVFETDSNLVVTYANEKAIEMFGYTREDLKRGIMVLDLISSDEYDKGKNNITLRFNESLKFLSQYTGLKKDGTQFPISMHSSPIFAEGKPAGLRGVVIDISYQKKINEAMSRNQRLESLGFLAGGIAHDFNNLILGLFGSVENARHEIERGNIDGAISILNSSLPAFERAKGLTLQLLTFSKGGKPIKKPGNIVETLKTASDFAFSGKNIIPELIIEKDSVSCSYDSTQISQVVDNILINAIQACSGKGKITIETQSKTLKKNNATMLSHGKYLSIKMKDNGKGITKEIIPKIFDPFFTTKKDGNGLGLAISWSIIKNHGGTICVNSEPGKGTTFEILLPISEEKISMHRKTVSGKIDSLRILVMDDEFLIREVAGKILSDSGFAVEKASDGEEAVEKYKAAMERNERVDVVILDLTIPGGKGGVDTLKTLKQYDPQVKAIASSGFSEDDVIARPKDYGFIASIPKPYLKESLISLILEILSDQSS